MTSLFFILVCEQPLVIPTLRVGGEDVLFAHWPVDGDSLRSAVPETLTLETFEGNAWLTILCHEVVEATLDAAPVTPIGGFGEVDLRTYVRFDGESGVYFFSCNTGQELNAILGERVFGLPHRRATVDIDRRSGRTILRSRQAGPEGSRYDVTYRPTGAASPADSGSLGEFLVERHTYFTPTDKHTASSESMIVGSIEREPWQLSDVDANVRTNTLPESAGIDSPTAAPTFHYSPEFTSRFVDREIVPLQ